MATIAFLFACVGLYIYLVLSSIEYGMSVFRLFPKLVGDNNSGSYINPIWETTTVFLVYFIVSLMAFFPTAFSQFGRDMLPELFAAVGLLAIRGGCMMAITYGEIKSKTIDLLFAATGILIPVAFALVCLYGIAGNLRLALFSPLALVVALFAASASLFLSASFWSCYFKSERFSKLAEHFSAIMFLIIIVFAFLSAFYLPHLYFGRATDAIIWATLLLIALFGYKNFKTAFDSFKAFVSASLTVLIIFFGLLALQMPYIIYPAITVNNAVTDSASLKILFIAMAIGLVLLLPCLALLFYLFLFNKKQVTDAGSKLPN